MGYSKAETEKKQRKLVSKTQRNGRKILVAFFKIVLVCIIAVIIAGAGAGFGMMKGILDNAPDASNISIMPKGFRTNIYDKDGNVEKEIATIDSNRVYVYYDQIPKDYVNAFVAIEDARFWTHNGIDVRGIFRAFVNGAKSGNFNEGASTLTQQLIKNQVFNVGLDETTFMDKLERKIQEQYLAIELEKKYTKEEIVEYYLNTIYLGRGVSGIQAASEKYFGKDMTELTVSEIAVIAGITQNPSRDDPVANPDEKAKRRQKVRGKILQYEYITQ
ncbi:MAG: transglycosylase domain-containing protein, partial [Clostridium sp.]|nr:transglycosylase domain-containing protein [Clostridium sp.]